jgi:tetratricopeptide (TPR) repeat protein
VSQSSSSSTAESAAGAAVDLSRLPALLQLDAGTVDVALQRLLQLGLVVVEHDRARCASRAAAASLRQGCDESVAFHRLLAMALLSEEAEAPSRLAWHLVGGEDVETALDRGPGLLARVTLMDPGEGARLAEALWALAPSPAMAARRIDALHLAGKVDEAIAFGEEKRAAGEVDVDLLVALARALLSRADDTEAAIATAGQARGLLQGMAPPLALVLIEAKALFRADRIDEAIAICAQAPAPAADSAVELLDDWLTLRVVQAQSIHRAGDVHAAILNLEEVPPRFGYGRPARALLDGCLGRLLYHAGRFGDAAEVMGRAAATDAGLSALDRARMLNNAGLVSYQSGRRLKALEHWEEALLLFERLSAPVDQIRVSVNLCVGYREAGRWERGRQAGTWAAEAAAKRELPELEAMAAGNVGDLFLDQRRFTDAERWYLKAWTASWWSWPAAAPSWPRCGTTPTPWCAPTRPCAWPMPPGRPSKLPAPGPCARSAWPAAAVTRA